MNRAIPAKPIAFAAAALFSLLCAAALAQAENSPSAPPVDERVYSLGDFNRMIDRLRPVYIYTVEAYPVKIELPLCIHGACAPAFMLISDTPPSRITNARVKELINQFPIYEYNTRTIENALNETQSGHAFRVVNAERTVQLEPEKRYRLRIRATGDERRYRSGFVLEDSCAEPNCGKRRVSTPFADARVYSLGEFSRMRLIPVVHTVEAHVVALAYPQCKPGGYCPPIAALISDTPKSRIANEKAKRLIYQFTSGTVRETENGLNKLQSGHAFRVLGLKLDLNTGKKLKQAEPEKPYRFRIRVTSNDAGSGLFMEDFCSVSDCAGRSERDASTHTQ
jgi:hypothetical protein